MTGRIARVTNQLSDLHGFSVHERREFNEEWPEPRRVMFIYIRVNRNQTLVIDQYVYDMKDGETIEKAERYLLRNARPGPRNNPRPKNPPRWATGFDRVSFGWEPCYVTMVIDDAYWKFHPWPDNAFEETVIFRKDKLLMKPDASGELKPTEYPFQPNHSFFNFKRGAISGRQSIRFVNFMRVDKEGTPMPPEPAHLPVDQKPIWEYCMDVYIAMPYNFSRKKQADGTLLEPNKWLTLIFDPPQDNGGGSGPP